MDNLLTFVSAAAFAAFILCFAFLSAPLAEGGREEASPSFCRARRNSARVSALCALAAFYFVPVGSLPPFIDFEFGGFIAAALLVSSALLDVPHGALNLRAAAKSLVFPTAFCLAWALLALFVSRAGVPGALGCLGTYSVMPLWSAAGVWGGAGMVFLLLLLLCAFPEIPRRSGVSRAASESCAAVLRASLCAALVTALLLPWNISEFVETGGFLSFWLDFIFFWMKVLLAAAAASFVSRRAGDVAFRRTYTLYAALIICGAVCMFIETGIF